MALTQQTASASMENPKKRKIIKKGEELLYKPKQGERLKFIFKEKGGLDGYGVAVAMFQFEINEIIKSSTVKSRTLTIKRPRVNPKYDASVEQEIKRLCAQFGGKEKEDDTYVFPTVKELKKVTEQDHKYKPEDFEESYLAKRRRKVFDHYYTDNFTRSAVLEQYSGLVKQIGGNMEWVRRGGPVEFAFKDEIKEQMRTQKESHKIELDRLRKHNEAKLTKLKTQYFDRLNRKDSKIEELEDMVKELKSMLPKKEE